MQVTTTRLSIVVVDDDRNGRRMLCKMLERQGHTVAGAEDGVAGLNLIRMVAPDAVMLDLRMPVLSGLDLLRILRADPATAHLLIVIVSASAQLTVHNANSLAGANASIDKPVDFVSVNKILDGLCAKRDAALHDGVIDYTASC